jgi:hypothetical protein
MKIGLIVEGDAEYHAFPNLLPRVASPHTILRQPLRCPVQPLSPPALIAHVAATKSFPILIAKGVDLIVLVIDKETRPECTIELVQEIEREARSRLDEKVGLRVVLKITKLENWLIADPQALRDLPGLFEHVERIEKQVAPGRADAVDAHGLLKTCSRKRAYDKKAGAIEICKKLDPERARKNSRSFRKLLKTLGCAEPPAETKRGRARRP